MWDENENWYFYYFWRRWKKMNLIKVIDPQIFIEEPIYGEEILKKIEHKEIKCKVCGEVISLKNLYAIRKTRGELEFWQEMRLLGKICVTPSALGSVGPA